MTVELKVPSVGESIREVQIGQWLKQTGDHVKRDENIVEIETDKASVELPAPATGVIIEILKKSGEMVAVGDIIGYLDEGNGAQHDGGASSAKAKQSDDGVQTAKKETQPESKSQDQPEPAPAASEKKEQGAVMPAARRMLAEQGLQAPEVSATGPGGRLLKEDVQRHVDQRGKTAADGSQASTAAENRPKAESSDKQLEEVVPMSLIRRRIAERLVEAQQHAALLTTFNEIDMTAVMGLRSNYKDAFEKKHQIKLGFMSFFAKAVVDALKHYPELNAEIRDSNIVYRNYYNLGIATGGGKGLVVPVLRHAERMSFAEIELAIGDFGRRARDNKIKPDELMGGTFTITNGGIYGSLLSTPIVNPPQSGVLGMHAIQERPVARNGQVVIRPMMYVALTYDHRIVDGQGAVSCLKRIKDVLEDPARMLIEV